LIRDAFLKKKNNKIATVVCTGIFVYIVRKIITIMYSTVAYLLAFYNFIALVQSNGTDTESNSWKTYGYIILGGIVLIIAIVVLVRKQHRKFNE